MQVICNVRPAWPAEVQAASLQRQEQPCTDILISTAMTCIAYMMARVCLMTQAAWKARACCEAAEAERLCKMVYTHIPD